MSLLAIKQHMQLVKIATLASLCLLFAADAETMRCLLKHWMQKGNIRICPKKPNCGTKCHACPIASSELYEWIENPCNQQVTPLTCF